MSADPAHRSDPAPDAAPERPRSRVKADWSDLQTFQAVAQAGSLGGAARALGVNHSTVLRRLAALESALGSRLFDRLPSGYALTAAGNELAEDLGGVAEQVDAAQRRLLGLDAEVRGAVKLACSDVVVESLLLPLLAQFRRLHPALRVQVVIGQPYTGLSRQEADLALRSADRAPASLIARHVGDLESVLCASRDYVAAAGSGLPLAQHRWVAPDPVLALGLLDAWLREQVPPDRIVMRIDSLVGMADAVAAGFGVGLLPRALLARRPQLVALAPPDPALARPLWLLLHPDAQRIARVRALADFLHDGLSAHGLLGHG